MLQIHNRGLFRTKLAELINEHSLENESDTPDFILAEYLTICLETFGHTVNQREQWYGRKTDCPVKQEAQCIAQHNDLFCNLPPEHEGPHQALGQDGSVLESWED